MIHLVGFCGVLGKRGDYNHCHRQCHRHKTTTSISNYPQSLEDSVILNQTNKGFTITVNAYWTTINKAYDFTTFYT